MRSISISVTLAVNEDALDEVEDLLAQIHDHPGTTGFVKQISVPATPSDLRPAWEKEGAGAPPKFAV